MESSQSSGSQALSDSFLFNNNVRVHSYSTQGGRKYMEDTFSIAFSSELINQGLCPKDETVDRDDVTMVTSSCLKYVYVGIYDGHGGKEAALFTRQHLLNNITSNKLFWSDVDADVLQSIREGFLTTHHAMTNELDKWPTTHAGLPSTSGTTASVCFIMNNKYYTGHVGDSKIVLGKKHRETKMWIAHPLTQDHKPDSPEEKKRIAEAGGEVMNKSGVDRVVWYRPKNGHKGPIRRSTNFDRIPFLAVARSLGDLWSYNPDLGTYIVSPDPDVGVVPIDKELDQCLVFASDGLWNMVLEHESIRLVQEIQEPDQVDRHLLNSLLTGPGHGCKKMNPSKALVDLALQKWSSNRLRSDNTSVVTLTFEKRDLEPVPLTPPQLDEGEERETLLPFCMESFEYVISSDENQLGPVEYFIESFNSAFANVPKPILNHDNGDLPELKPASSLSLPLESLCSFTNGQFYSTSDQQVPSTPPTSDPWNTEHSDVYVNELPDDRFTALSNALKMSASSSSNQPKAHKVISGVEVYKDYTEDDDSRSSEENDETRALNGKTYRDESCSVSEELVDRHQHLHSLHHESHQRLVASRIPRQPSSDHILKEVAENGGFNPDKMIPIINRKCFSEAGSEGNVAGISFKRRRSSSEQTSPPAKHLRSSTRSIVPLTRAAVRKYKWSKLAATILTKSRLRTRKGSSRL